MSRCLYNSSFEKFINADENSIFGALCDMKTASGVSIDLTVKQSG